MIKKYKNGKIILDIKEELKNGYFTKEISSVENFYHNDMFMNDLYINQINGYQYIVDHNAGRVYDLPRNHFILFLEDLARGEKIVLEPYSKRASKDLLQDLENGY